MAFLTGDLGMQTSQRVFGFGVIEVRNVFPIGKVMALLAIGTEPSVVLVLMAGGTCLR